MVKIKDRATLPTDLLQYRFVAFKYISFKRFTANQLISMSHFMSHKPVTGLSTLNRVLAMPFKLFNKISKWQIPVPRLHHDQNRLLYIYSKYFIVRDLELLFSRLRNQD
jgi:hypothetical protein